MGNSAINYTGSAGGRVVQVVNYETGTKASGSTAIPYDNTIPQNTEGDEYFTKSITPTNASNILKIDVVVMGSPSSNWGVVALFQDTTADALASAMASGYGTDNPECIAFTHYMTAGTTNSTTFKVRAGCHTSGTFTLNGVSDTAYFGTTLSSSITITEIALGRAAGVGSGGAITGEMRMWTTDTAPDGWLLADGSAVSQTTYSDLYAVIGTTYGNPGGGNFNLPDMRGRVPLGKDNMGGSSANRVTATQADNLGQGSGAETHTLSTAELASHSHAVTAFGTQGSVFTGTTGMGGTGNLTGNSGSGSSHNNVQPYMTINYIIKT